MQRRRPGMRTRFVVPFIVALAMVPALYLLFTRSNADEVINPGSTWRPTTSEIEKMVTRGPVTDPEDPRLDTFSRLFKQRYRDHQRAVGMKFISPTEIKAMFEPGISRWEMTQIATQADQETSQIFGCHFEIGIYETYITVIRKVGILKYDQSSNKIVVRFGPEFSNERGIRVTHDRLLANSALRYLGSFIPLAQTEAPAGART